MSRTARDTQTLLSIAAATVLAVTVHGQQSPTYKLEVDVIPVDLVVIDREGRPVPGLRPEDFQVAVDGQPRKVVTAQFLSSAAVPARQPDAPRKGGWEIDAAFESVYVGNHRATGLEKEPSRSVLIAIDQNGFGTAEGRSAANTARALLDVLHPNDRVGLAVFPPPGPFVRPTRDHGRVRLALGQVTGASEPPPRTEFALNVSEALGWSSGDKMARDRITQGFCSTMTALSSCEAELDRSATEIVNHARRQSVNTIRGLEAVIRAASSDGSAVAVVLISTGVFATGRATQLGVDGDVRTLGRQAAASRAMVYALYVDLGFLGRDTLDKQRVSGFSTEDSDLRRAGLQYIAGAAGGTFSNASLGSDAAFRRLSLDSAAYYLLGIEGVAADRDGRRHRLQVTVSRPGVTARTREDLYVPAARRLTGEDAVREALGAPDLERELPIRLATQMMREPGTGKVRLLISAAIGEGVQAPAPVRVGYLLQGSGPGATAGLSDVQSRTLAVLGSGAECGALLRGDGAGQCRPVPAAPCGDRREGPGGQRSAGRGLDADCRRRRDVQRRAARRSVAGREGRADPRARRANHRGVPRGLPGDLPLAGPCGGGSGLRHQRYAGRPGDPVRVGPSRSQGRPAGCGDQDGTASAPARPLHAECARPRGRPVLRAHQPAVPARSPGGWRRGGGRASGGARLRRNRQAGQGLFPGGCPEAGRARLLPQPDARVGNRFHRRDGRGSSRRPPRRPLRRGTSRPCPGSRTCSRLHS